MTARHVRVLVAPDKFKGSLTAAEVAEALADGLRQADRITGVGCASVSVRTLPLADGGDGSVAAAMSAGYTAVPIEVVGPDGSSTAAVMAVDGATALVEVATTCGITMMHRQPDAGGTTSHGVGDAINAALRTGARRVVVGLGGSATTDGGAGMLAALGARFLTATGVVTLPTGANLAEVTRIDISELCSFDDIELVGACDVRNPLLGGEGAASVFAPQKGADAATVALLERNLSHLSDLLTSAGFSNASAAASLPGAGAAGGIGFAVALLGGRLVSGADLLLDLLDYDDLVEECDLIITGEGSLDDQTANGKLVSVVVKRAAGRPVYAVAGVSQFTQEHASRIGLTGLRTLADMTDADTAHDPNLSLALLRQIGTRIAVDSGLAYARR